MNSIGENASQVVIEPPRVICQVTTPQITSNRPHTTDNTCHKRTIFPSHDNFVESPKPEIGHVVNQTQAHTASNPEPSIRYSQLKARPKPKMQTKTVSTHMMLKMLKYNQARFTIQTLQ